jgi:hypothetical protein
MTRIRAALIHLSISLAIGAIAFSLLYFVYYPQPYFQISGADRLVMILLAVDVVLGPLLTLSVFKSGKWGMKFDLWVIGTLQMAALVYGLHIMWVARPVFVVAVTERFNLAFAHDFRAEDLAKAKPEFQLPLFGPKLVGAVVPSDSEERSRLLDITLAEGRDIEYFPQYFVPYDDQFAAQFTQNARESSYLKEKGEKVTSDFRYLPLRGRFGDGALEIGPDNRPGALHLVDPW